MAANPAFPDTPALGLVAIAPADTSDLKTLLTAPAEGQKVVGIGAVGEDTADRLLQLVVTRSAVDYILGTVNVPTNAGLVDATAPVDILAQLAWLPLDNDGQRYLLLVSGDVLKVRVTTTVTADKEVIVSAVAGSF